MKERTKTKILSFLGVCGCLSCYVAMFPALLLGILGVVGFSQSSAVSALNAYTGFVLFQPILIVSIILLVAGMLRYGKWPLWLSILGGIGIFLSMTFYMREWLFTLSFAVVALAYYLALRHTKSPQLRFALVFLVGVVGLSVIDIGRPWVTKNFNPPAHTQPQPTKNDRVDMGKMR